MLGQAQWSFQSHDCDRYTNFNAGGTPRHLGRKVKNEGSHWDDGSGDQGIAMQRFIQRLGGLL